MRPGEAFTTRSSGAPHAALVGVLAVVALALALQPPPSAAPAGGAVGSATSPLTFVPNAGQTDATVRYMARGPGHAFYFTPDKAVLDFQRGKRGVALELRFRGANPAPAIVAERRAPGRMNYIVGSERHTGLATYEQLRYRDLWPGIDMVFRGEGGALKYEFLVSPGADPADIRLAYAGADSLTLAANGWLAIGTPLGTLRDMPPVARQGKESTPAHYDLNGSAYGFAVGSYDTSRSMVLDPGLVYSTFLGGSEGDDTPHDIAVDAAGSAYVTGLTYSPSFPTTTGGYDPIATSDQDAYVTKFAPNGGSLVYSTVIGGHTMTDCGSTDQGRGIAVDGAGNAFIMGTAIAPDFPTTPGAFETTHPGTSCSSAFVTKLNAAGSDLVYSTFVGGSDTTSGALAIDGAGNAYISGGTFDPNYPTTPGAFDTTHSGSRDVYHSKVNATGSALVYSTFLGGSGASDGIAVDASGNAYVAVYGSGFPTTPGAFDTTANGSGDAGVLKVNTTGTALIYGTYLGGSSTDQATDIAVDSAGGAHVTGQTGSTDFPSTPAAYDPTYNGGTDVFVTKLNPAGSALAYSTFIGGSSSDQGHAIDLDAGGGAYVTGLVTSPGFPTTSDAFDPGYDGGDMDAFVSRLSPSGAALAYSTFLGADAREIGRGIAADDAGNAYVTGETFSVGFPTSPGAFDTTYNGQRDAFVTKLNTTPFPGYPRPKGATPAFFALTTAYEQCTDPNEIHGPPLAYGSCAAPQQTSDYLTVGTGDANGLPARNEGYVRFSAMLGIPSTPADEADVRIQMFSDDVFTKASLADYTGELRAQFIVRITDRDNAPTGGGPAGPGTTVDVPLGATFGCTPVADPQEGSSCAATTSMDAISPGAVTEGKRSVWQLDQVRLFDGGADGDGDTVGDNTLFARAGLFVP